MRRSASLDAARRERDRALRRLREAVRAAERRGVLVPLEEFCPLWDAYRAAEQTFAALRSAAGALERLRAMERPGA